MIITDEDYFFHPGMSQSKLKEFKKSPRHFYIKYVAENKYIEPVTEAMEFGKALHRLLFEPELFDKYYSVSPICDRRTHDGKKKYNDFITDSKNKTVISNDIFNDISQIITVIKNKEMSKTLINNGIPELPIFWNDPIYNISCKAKLDYFIEPNAIYPNGMIIDLKTTKNSNYKEFSSTIYNFGYHNQASFYCEGIKTLYKLNEYPLFCFIVCEKTPPYECRFFCIDDFSLKIGAKENYDLLSLYNNCVNLNIWHGYPDEIELISLPEYITNKYKLC